MNELKPGEVVINSDGSCLFKIRVVHKNNTIVFHPICKIHNSKKCYDYYKNLKNNS